MNVHSQKNIYVFILAFLSVFVLKAQDCNTITYLESQTVKAGDIVTIGAGTIVNQPGKQFVVENSGNAALQGSKRIELNYGFKALAGSVMKATVVPCDPNEPPADPVVVYPNPTDGVFTVKASYKIDGLRLTDTSGIVQLEKSDVNDTSISLDISKLKSGYYLLEVIVGKSVMETVRIEKK